MSAATPLPPPTTWERLHANRWDCLLSVVAAFACGLFAGRSIDWVIAPEAVDLSTATAHVIDPAGVVVENAAIASAAKESPGVYRVLVVKTGEKIATTVVTIGGEPEPPNPTPNPNPVPPPDPAPTPVADLWGVVVEESAERSIDHSILFSKGEFRGLFSLGCRILDDDPHGATGTLAEYQRRAAGKPLPWLVVADKAGVIRFEGECPKDLAAVRAIVDKAKGGGR